MMDWRPRRTTIAASGLLFVVLCVSDARAQVGSPSPADKATNVPVSTSLSWSADPRASRYDVYLGTTNPPPVVVRNQIPTNYQPPTLQPSTTYYWRVDSKGSKGYSSSGPVWSFTSAAPPVAPPSLPSNPSPASGSTGVAINTALSWSASSNASSYDVAFGTTSTPPTVSAAQGGTTYQPAALSYSQTYYWRITARGAGGTTAGPIWSFTTTPAPPSTSRDRLRLLTWNVQSGRNASGAAAVDTQAALMADSGADVIALQEVTITPDYGDLTVLYKSKLETLTGVPWYQVWAPEPRPADQTPEGNLILSRIPILSSTTTQFDTAPADPTFLDGKQSAAGMTVVVNNVAVNVLTTRLAVDATHRQQQLDLFQTWASAFQAPRVIGGDFNMIAGDPVYNDMASTVVDVWPLLAGTAESGFTQDVQTVVPNQPARVDYWFQEPTDQHAKASEIWVVKTTRSSHHAVVVDVEVK
jgi:endonuclease/exonuclease/phosphatase family metal-dependent hydrolase